MSTPEQMTDSPGPSSERTVRREQSVTIPVWLFQIYEEAYFRLRHGLEVPTPQPPLEQRDPGSREIEEVSAIMEQIPPRWRARGILATEQKATAAKASKETTPRGGP